MALVHRGEEYLTAAARAVLEASWAGLIESLGEQEKTDEAWVPEGPCAGPKRGG